MTWQLASPRVSDQRVNEPTPKTDVAVLYNLISKGTYHCFCSSLLGTEMNRVQCERGSVEANLEAGYKL